jgi:hypothetical protein
MSSAGDRCWGTMIVGVNRFTIRIEIWAGTRERFRQLVFIGTQH